MLEVQELESSSKQPLLESAKRQEQAASCFIGALTVVSGVGEGGILRSHRQVRRGGALCTLTYQYQLLPAGNGDTRTSGTGFKARVQRLLKTSGGSQ